MIVGILGASGTEFAEMEKTLNRMGHEALTVCDDAIVVTCGHPDINIGVALNLFIDTVIDKDNSFRGGSRGKGGKIKYPRR